MQQVVQDIRRGKLSVMRVPDPIPPPGQVLIANAASVISAGTEKMVMDLASKSLLGKARERPDHVRRVLEKIRTEGLIPTIRAVMNKLDEPMKMGYASAGMVIAAGAGVQEYKVGDRVASNGPHAGVVSVPRHLVARIPDSVSYEQGAFTVLGAIALQGVRLAQIDLGGTAFVIGLGLVGQLTVALLRAAGCRVIGTDPDASKCELAIRMGAQIARPGLSASAVADLTGGLGTDAVLITASTKSNGPIELAANAVRQKGRVVLVGVVGLELDRRPFYFKEAEFVVSCSYGPGRYDPNYEDRGIDYPAAYVRWTEQRNMQAVLDLMGGGRLDVSPLISHRYPIDDAEKAYAMIESGGEPYLGIVLQYPAMEEAGKQRRITLRAAPVSGGIGIGAIGAGNFARMVLLPAIGKCPALKPVLICSAGGLSATHTGDKLGFEAATTDENEVFCDPKVQAVFAITRHDQHARQVIAAIEQRKHIFVEKPLCLNETELGLIEQKLEQAGDRAPLVMVGFNRRFSPSAQQARKLFAGVTSPLSVSFRFNAGAIPAGHWTQDELEGGGRIIGEACHAIDLATYLVDSPVVRVYAESVGGTTAGPITDDQCFITLRHASGSISQIAYLASGDRALAKERVEIFGGGLVAVIDDFRVTQLISGGKTRTIKGAQDKGHGAEIAAFASAISGGGAAPIPWRHLRSVSLAAILAVRSLREGMPIDLV